MFGRTFKDLRRTALWYGIGVAIYGMMILLYFPTVRENSETLNQYIKSFPEAMVKAFGITDMTTLPGFIGAEYLNLMWPLIVSVFVIMAGAALVGQEVERGTAELWLSVPEDRGRLLGGKLVALLAAIAGLVILSLATIEVGALLVGETVGILALVTTGVVMLAYGVAVGGYSALFSSFSDDRARPAGMAAGLTLAFYLLYVLGGLSDRWAWLKKASIFTAFQPQRALESGTVPVVGVVILLAIGIISAIAAVVIFRRRDVAV